MPAVWNKYSDREQSAALGRKLVGLNGQLSPSPPPPPHGHSRQANAAASAPSPRHRRTWAVWHSASGTTLPPPTLSKWPPAARSTFSNSTSTSIGFAHAYFPGEAAAHRGLLWLNPTYNSTWGTNDLVTPKIGQWGALTYIHELGHALGLDHPGNYNGGNPTYGSNALYTMDTIQYTVMSYFDRRQYRGRLDRQRWPQLLRPDADAA